MRLLALIFGESIWKINSNLIGVLLKLKGVTVGKRFYIQGIPQIILGNISGSIVIGDDVRIMGDVDLRTRENGRIIIGNNCKIDAGVRMIAANDATLTLGKNAYIGFYSVINCGCDVSIGSFALISGHVYIQSSNHGIQKGQNIREQKNEFKPILIEDDVWLGSHVSVLAGAILRQGCVIGSKGVVNGEIESNAIAVGVPAKVIKHRTGLQAHA
jgi:acetyltransferase-like isoleucine patch superfamily enzyme